MARNIVICCDGTNNEFGPENTNVVRLIQVLDRDPAKQRLYYDPGVGTLPEPGALSAFGKWISKVFGLAFGGGLIWKVQQAYSYLMDHWEPGDQVFVFGFSRGAYTARVLAGMLHSIGLLPRGGQNLVPYAMRLFKAVRVTGTHGGANSASEYWKLCNQFRWTFARPLREGDDERRFRVHFLGVWDTVSSVGWVWDPVKFPFTAHNPSIDVIRHAVSVDERRWFFRQNLMQPKGQQDIKEMWFPGVHCDVGGGYPHAESRLWRMSLEWMLKEAVSAGLLVDPQRLARILPELSEEERLWIEPQHESLNGVWWIAEFFPKLQWQASLRRRRLRLGLGRHRPIQDNALIHQAALLRIRDKPDYRPPNMSSEFLQTVRALGSVPEALPYHPITEDTRVG